MDYLLFIGGGVLFLMCAYCIFKDYKKRYDGFIERDLL